MDNGEAVEKPIKGGNHAAFNSPMTKDNSPMIHFYGGKNDNVADNNSLMERDNSPIDSKIEKDKK
jgi:hypothetical protein